VCVSVCLYLLRYELLSLVFSFELWFVCTSARTYFGEENSKREVRGRKTKPQPLTLIRTFIRIIHRKTHLCT
jgi:hypothetical protein